jgi:hypothetical protein
MQVNRAVKAIKRVMVPTGVTTPEAIKALSCLPTFSGLQRTTLKVYVLQAFRKLENTGDYDIVKEGTANMIVPKEDVLKSRIVMEAAEMRKAGTPRLDIVTILSQDFGLTKGDVRYYLRGSN